MQNQQNQKKTAQVKLPATPSKKEEGKKDKAPADTKAEKPEGKEEPEKKAPAEKEKPARPSIPERDEKPKKEKEEAKKEPSNHWSLVALIVGALIAAAIYFKPVPAPPSVAPAPVVDASESNRKKMEKAKVEVEVEPAPVVVQEPRRVAPGPGHIGEPKAPPVVRWIRNGGYLVPVRQMPDGVAGYGETYTQPPTSGLPPQEDWAKSIAKTGKGWTRNERGDWAIPLR